MRPLAIALAVAHPISIGLAVLFASFVSSFPWENLTSEDERDFDRIALLLVGALALALATGVGVALDRPWAAVAFVIQLGLALVALGIALDHSDHSDERLLLFALFAEAAGVGAVVLAARRRVGST